MEHLIEDIVWLQDKIVIRGFVFGFVHTLIPLIGFYQAGVLIDCLKLFQMDM